MAIRLVILECAILALAGTAVHLWPPRGKCIYSTANHTTKPRVDMRDNGRAYNNNMNSYLGNTATSTPDPPDKLSINVGRSNVITQDKRDVSANADAVPGTESSSVKNSFHRFKQTLTTRPRTKANNQNHWNHNHIQRKYPSSDEKKSTYINHNNVNNIDNTTRQTGNRFSDQNPSSHDRNRNDGDMDRHGDNLPTRQTIGTAGVFTGQIGRRWIENTTEDNNSSHGDNGEVGEATTPSSNMSEWSEELITHQPITEGGKDQVVLIMVLVICLVISVPVVIAGLLSLRRGAAHNISLPNRRPDTNSIISSTDSNYGFPITNVATTQPM